MDTKKKSEGLGEALAKVLGPIIGDMCVRLASISVRLAEVETSLGLVPFGTGIEPTKESGERLERLRPEIERRAVLIREQIIKFISAEPEPEKAD